MLHLRQDTVLHILFTLEQKKHYYFYYYYLTLLATFKASPQNQM